MSSFRFQAIHVALTYPQCGLTKDQAYDHLITLRAGSISVSRLLISQETHEDGSPHLHGYIQFTGKPNIRNERFFDIEGHHPNIQPCRSPRTWIKYCTKTDHQPKSNFEWQSTRPVEQALRILRESNQEHRSVNDIVDKALDLDPGLIRCYTQLRSYVQDRHVQSNVSLPEYQLTTFSLTAADLGRMSGFQELLRSHRPGDRTHLQSMWFVGASRLGKTSLARSIGRHYYIGGTWNVDKINEEAQYGVIDDLPWEELAWKDNYKKILGLQKDFTLTDKYRHKKEFKLGIPTIICTNELPPFTPSQRDWLSINVLFFRIVSSLLPNNDPSPFTVLNI